MCAACTSSINQYYFEGEMEMLIKQSKKYCKYSKTSGRDCSQNLLSKSTRKFSSNISFIIYAIVRIA